MFKPGKSGNPSGRPKTPPEVKELARGYTEQAIATLGSIMGDESAPHSARVKAADTLLDRAWGKAESTVNINQITDVRDLSTAEILSALVANGAIEPEAGAGESPAVH